MICNLKGKPNWIVPTTSKPPRPHKTIYLPFYTLICPSLTLPARKVQKVPILFSRFTDEFCVFLFVIRRKGIDLQMNET